ncbi:MAG: TetR family transcriptional regulator [Pseudomonadota bacterium]
MASKAQSQPQQQRALATRSALVNAARTAFTEDGFSKTSIDRIVTTAGVTKGALFHHFRDKADLFREVWLSLEQEMNEEANRAASDRNRALGKDNPYAGFIAGCRVYFEFAERPDYRRIVMMDGAAVIGEYEWRRVDSAMAYHTIETGLNHLYECGAIRTPPTKALVIMIQGAVNGAGFAIARGEDGIHRDDLLARIEATLRRL